MFAFLGKFQFSKRKKLNWLRRQQQHQQQTPISKISKTSAWNMHYTITLNMMHVLFFSLLEPYCGTITEPGLPVVKLSKGSFRQQEENVLK